MKQEEFIKELMGQLRELNDEDKEQLRDYYDELIMDGMEMGKSEEEIVAEFGPANQVADRIRREHDEYGQMLSSLPEAVQKKGGQDYNTEKSKIHTVDIDARNIPIEIYRVQSADSVRIIFLPKAGVDIVTCETIDGTLTFRHKTRILGFNFDILGWLQGQRKIRVEIPTDFTGNLYVKTTNASVSLRNVYSLTSAKLVASNARITVDDIKCKSTYIKSTNGSLNLQNISGDELEAVTTNGRITANNCAMAFGMILTTKNCTIRVCDLLSDKIVLKSSNASITGSIRGDMRDYAIQSRTCNASCNLPNASYPDQKKHLVIKTSNARILIDFIP